MGYGPLSHGPGGRQQISPPGPATAGALGIPVSQGSQQNGHSAPHTNGFSTSNGDSNGNGFGNGLELGLPRPLGPIADPIPVRTTGGAGQGAQPGERAQKGGTAGVVHLDQRYLGGWQGNVMEQ